MGGGGGGKTTSTTQNYSPAEAARRAAVMDTAAGLYGQTKDQISSAPYPGAKPVGFAPETMAAQQYVTDFASGDAANTIKDLNAGVRFGLADVLDPNSNKYLQSAVRGAQDTLAQSYTDAGGVLSTIRNDARASGQYGGSRQGIAEGLAASRLGQQQSNLANQMYSDAYKSGLNTFGQTMEFAPQALQANIVPASMLSSVGAQKENLAQSAENYGAEARGWDLNRDWNALQNYANIVFGAGGSQSTTTGQQPRQSAFNQVASGVGLAASLAGLFSLSDRRLKRFATQVGKTANGINVYIWRFLWNEPGIGVMADEVSHIPGAVHVGSDGYARVNYAVI